MANITYPNWTPYSLFNNEFNHDASLEAELGDMAYLDEAENNIKPASSFTDQGDAASTQRAFAAYFAGILASRQLSTDSTGRPCKLLKDIIVEFPCASATFEAGDYVAPTYTAGVLSDQQVTKVTDVSRAVGKVEKRYASATTTVKVRFTSAFFMGLVRDSQAPETVSGAPGDAAGDAGAAIIYQGGEGADHTTGTAGAGGAATWKGGVGGNATTGTGGAGGATTVGGNGGGTATTGTGGAGGAVTTTSGPGGTATTGTAGAGGAHTGSAGAGGAASGAAGIGGAGGAWTANGGAGGAASDPSSGNAGAGGAWAGAAGAGGAATGTGAAAGGAGGAWTAGGGAGGTAAGTSAGGAGGAVTLSSGAGGAKTGTGAAVGGDGGALAITGGAGGATASSGANAGGAGASITLTGGAGGNATAGTGNGGAGGNINLTPGAGGTSSGGTAGARGLVIATGLVRKAGSTAVAITGATTLTQADSGGIFTVSQGSAYDIDLPSPTTGPGLSFLFHLTGAAANNVTITVAGGAATFVGTIVNDVTSVIPATGSTLTFASGAAALGDNIEIRSIATNLYHVRAVTSAAGGITIS